jgi:hypothetical protein
MATEIARIEQISEEALKINQGTNLRLFGALDAGALDRGRLGHVGQQQESQISFRHQNEA